MLTLAATLEVAIIMEVVTIEVGIMDVDGAAGVDVTFDELFAASDLDKDAQIATNRRTALNMVLNVEKREVARDESIGVRP